MDELPRVANLLWYTESALNSTLARRSSSYQGNEMNDFYDIDATGLLENGPNGDKLHISKFDE